jgi:hypothetical protein
MAAGWQQDNDIVYISGLPGSGVPEYIANGLALPGSAGNPLTLNSTWAFDRTMQFNVGFEFEIEVISEPSALALAALGLLGLALFGRRRTR